MSSALVISAVVGAGTAAYSANAQKKAAQGQANAIAKTGDLVYDQWKETEARLAPYSDAGKPALEKQQALSGSLGAEKQKAAYDDYVESPGVAWARERGLKGLNQNAAAQGDYRSGNLDKALIDYSQGSALQDFNNYFNRLGSVAGTGLAATQAMAGVGSNAASTQAQIQQNAAEVTAQGKMAETQSYVSGLSSLAGVAGSYYGGGSTNAANAVNNQGSYTNNKGTTFSWGAMQ